MMKERKKTKTVDKFMIRMNITHSFVSEIMTRSFRKIIST